MTAKKINKTRVVVENTPSSGRRARRNKPIILSPLSNNTHKKHKAKDPRRSGGDHRLVEGYPIGGLYVRLPGSSSMPFLVASCSRRRVESGYWVESPEFRRAAGACHSEGVAAAAAGAGAGVTSEAEVEGGVEQDCIMGFSPSL
jgi:hypothetical protein